MVAAIGDDAHLEIRRGPRGRRDGLVRPRAPGARRRPAGRDGGPDRDRAGRALRGRAGRTGAARRRRAGAGRRRRTAPAGGRRRSSPGRSRPSSLVSIRGRPARDRRRRRGPADARTTPSRSISSSSAIGARTSTWSWRPGPRSSGAATRSSRCSTSDGRTHGPVARRSVGVRGRARRASDARPPACSARSPAARWSASARTSGPARSATEQAAGYTDPELIKRRTGALTGPCQGKYCLQAFACLAGTDRPTASRPLPTARPPLRPIRLGDLVARDDDDPVSRPDGSGACSTTVRCRPRPTSSSSGPGSPGSPSPASWSARGVRDIVIVERGYPGGGATGRNVARIRAMQLTEELTHVALACQAKYDRMGEELGFNVLFYRLGYAWVLYEADEVERMRPIVDMHHRIGVASQLLSPDDTLRRLPILRGGEPVAGAVLNDDAIVHHDAVVWAHLEHLARTSVRIHAGHDGPGDRARGRRGVDGGRHRSRAGSRRAPSSTPPAAGRRELNALAGVSAPNRPLRREVLVTAPRPAVDRGGRHVLPPERGLVQPDAPWRDRHGRRRSGRAGRASTSARRGTSCAGPRRS